MATPPTPPLPLPDPGAGPQTRNISLNRHLTISLHVKSQIPGAADETRLVTVPDGPMNLAALIRASAASEWDVSGRLAREASAPDPADTRQPADREEAGRATIDAFRAGWFMVVVDDEVIPSLDVILHLNVNSRVRFARLYLGVLY